MSRLAGSTLPGQLVRPVAIITPSAALLNHATLRELLPAGPYGDASFQAEPDGGFGTVRTVADPLTKALFAVLLTPNAFASSKLINKVSSHANISLKMTCVFSLLTCMVGICPSS